MLTPQLISQIKRLQLKASHIATDTLMGEYISAFRGQGIEFDEVREYYPGDDIRFIDWNVTARMNQPYIKIFREEREMTLMLLIDVSPSQDFGSVARTKTEISAELAAILAFLATKNNDKVGLMMFSDHVELYIPAKKGRAHIWRIIKEILTHQAHGKTTNLSQALEYMMSVTKRKSMCFVISDFFCQDYDHKLMLAAKRHDVICVQVEDPREQELAGIGVVEFEDSESKERIIINSSKKNFVEEYAKIKNLKEQQRKAFYQKYRIDSFSVTTDKEVITFLEAFLRQRE